MHHISVRALLAAVLFSALAPSLALISLARELAIGFPIFLVALGHALVLGLPLFLILHWKGWVNALSSILGGFVVGCVPVGLLTLPIGYAGLRFNAWVGPDRTPTIVDGVATWAGWLQYFEGVGLFGAVGAFAGLVFWLALKMATGIQPPDASPSSRFLRFDTRQGALLVTAVLLSGAVLSLPVVTKDRSCHNMFRDGRTSIGSEVNIDLQIEMQHWGQLASTLEGFGKTHGLSFRNSSRSEPGVFSMIAVSLCSEKGVNLHALDQRWRIRNYDPLLPGHGVSIGVYVTRDGAAWAPLARALVAELEATWPDKVKFISPSGRAMPKPAVLE